ncbi:serine protease inhibitor swm-1-like [Battus philenor]|uniref:serine protease inhibitor swm-1-like n=1 Tax=Battus philenor TaxID=42288 RepID=UPI0035CFA4F1
MRAGLFVCFIAIAGAVGEGCGENEIFKRCGPACQRSCDNPNPTCTDQCVTGCFCSGDRVRDDETQQCIEVSECPAPSLRIKRSKHQDLAIKIPGCGQNEVFKVCGPACQKSCKNPNPTCSGQCVTGCFCSGDRVRDDETQQCIEVSKCPTLPTKKRSSLFQDPSCKANEEFKLCETCYKSCDNPTPSCSDHCERGCFCKEGLVRDRDGKCVTLDQCSGGNGSGRLN